MRLLKANFRHRFRLAGLSRLPLLGTVMDWALFGGDDLVVLPRDRVVELEVNKRIEPPLNTVLPSEVVHRFIDWAETHFVMDYCICREASGCTDYPRDLGCLFMGEAAGRIDPRVGRIVSREEAHGHVRRAGEAGLVHLVGRNKLDSLWLDAWPNGRLLTVCNCCPCCCLWRMLPRLSPRIGGRVTRMEGVELRVTGDCTGCGACLDKCFVQAIGLVDGRAVIGDDCRGCGRCAEACPSHAIEVTLPDEPCLGRTVTRIGEAVDVS